MEKEIILDKLKNIPLFKGVVSEDLKNFVETKVNITAKRLTKKEIVLHQSATYNDLYILIEGICVGEMIDLSGKTVNIEEFNSPFLIAPGVLFSSKNFIPVSVTAKTDVEILILSKNDILKLCKLSEKITENLLTLISEKVTFLSQRLSFMCFKCIKAKIAHYILVNSKGNDRFVLPHTLEELAVYFGIARPSLSRVIKKMEEEGIVKKENKEIQILDRESLLEFED